MDWFNTKYRQYTEKDIFLLADFSLTCIYSSMSIDRESLEKLTSEHAKKIAGIENLDFRVITSLLLEDKLIYVLDVPNVLPPMNDVVYRITIKGFSFIAKGGYTLRQRKENEALRRKRVETNILLAGAVLGGLYSITEVWKSIRVAPPSFAEAFSFCLIVVLLLISVLVLQMLIKDKR